MKTKKLVRTALLLALALMFQIVFRQFAQPLVGPLVNMTLILATLMVGVDSGVFIGVLTPVVAFLMGIVSVAPLVPIIAIGNILLVVIICFFNQKTSIKGNKWVGILSGAFVKYAFLTISVRALLPLLIPKVPPVMIAAFSLPQLYTAIIGGVLALIIYPLINKKSEVLT